MSEIDIEDRRDRIMLGMGFEPGDSGPFVSAFRAHIGKKVSEGLRGHSYGSWAPDIGPLSAEERARAFLEIHWAIERGYSSRVEAIDGLDPKNPMPWLRDQARRAVRKLRVVRDKALGISNPYSELTP